MQVTVVIPARLASTRLEAKLLKDLAGMTVLERTYRQASQAKHVSEVVIATDSDEIYKVAESFGAKVEMTSADHQSGTDRIAELAKKNSDWELIINVQGDEPFINPDDIDKVIEPFLHDPLLEMASLYHCITDADEINNPNNVKLVTDLNGLALYFSRSSIPFNRDKANQLQSFPDTRLASSKEPELTGASMRIPENERNAVAGSSGVDCKKHIGLYAYKRDTLLRLSSLPQSELEKTEKLEQLRALENGIKIKMLEVASAPIGIDTESDYLKALNWLEEVKGAG